MRKAKLVAGNVGAEENSIPAKSEMHERSAIPTPEQNASEPFQIAVSVV
jgi:hypothetical protein